MRRSFFAIMCLWVMVSETVVTVSGNINITYPKVLRKEGDSDTYFEKKILNPYKWLTSASRKEQTEYCDSQNNATASYVSQLSAANRKTITALVRRYEHEAFLHFTAPIKAGDKYFILEAYQSKLYVGKWPKEKAIVFSSSSKKDAVIPKVVAAQPSPSGNFILYAEQAAAFDSKYTFHVAKPGTGKQADDELQNVTFSRTMSLFVPTHNGDFLQWNAGDTGIFYTSENKEPWSMGTKKGAGNITMYVFYHQLGTKQSEDIFMAELTQEQKKYCLLKVTDDGKYLVVIESFIKSVLRRPTSTAAVTPAWSKLSYIELCTASQTDAPCKPTKGHKLQLKSIPKLRSSYQFLGNRAKLFYLLLEEKAAENRIVEVDLQKSSEKDWATLIAFNSSQGTLTTTAVSNSEYLLTAHARDGKSSSLQVRKLSDIGNVRRVPLDYGLITAFGVGRNEKNVFLTMHTLVEVQAAYVLDLGKSLAEVAPKKFQLPEHAMDSFRDKILIEQKSYKAPDGEALSIYILHEKGLKMDGSAPAIMFASSAVATHSRINKLFVPFMETFHGVIAIAQIQTNHHFSASPPNEASLHSLKAAAEFLIEKKYTSVSRLTVAGGSGFTGLLGACINQYPQILGAALFLDTDSDLDLSPLFKTKESMGKYLSISPIHNIRSAKEKKVSWPAVYVNGFGLGVNSTMRYLAELQHQLGTTALQAKPLLGHFLGTPKHGMTFIPGLRNGNLKIPGSGYLSEIAIANANFIAESNEAEEDREAEEFSDMFSFLALALNYTVTTMH